MIYRLLTSLTIVICLSLIIPSIQPVSAQTPTSYTHIQILQQLILAKTPTPHTSQVMAARTARKPRVTPTPTLYIQPSPTPTKAVTKPTPTPTKIITISSPTPTKAITNASPSPTPSPTKLPTVIPTAVPTDTITYIMNEINKYRASQGLSSVTTSSETCNFATIRAAEIVTSFNHTGFQNRINNKTLPYTSWTKVTENIALTSQYKDVVNMWINSPGHAANMRADTPFVCVRQNGNNYAYEGMKP